VGSVASSGPSCSPASADAGAPEHSDALVEVPDPTPTPADGVGPAAEAGHVLLVISGPGGAGKGTIAEALVAGDPDLTLSRSWTTRPRRIDDAPDAYVFVDLDAFLAHRDAGGFLEWNEFLGELYGTPMPDDQGDLLLEIDVAGGRQVRDHRPEALLVFVEAPSDDELRRRLLGRGEAPDRTEARIAEAGRERAEAVALGYATVVNDDLGRALAVIDGLLAERRS